MVATSRDQSYENPNDFSWRRYVSMAVRVVVAGAHRFGWRTAQPGGQRHPPHGANSFTVHSPESTDDVRADVTQRVSDMEPLPDG